MGSTTKSGFWTPDPSTLTPYALIVSKSGSGSGTVTSNPSGINCGSTCSADFTGGDTVILTATPASGSTFAGWSGACTGAGSCSVTMDSAKNVTASFEPAPFVANTTSLITATSATITTVIAINPEDQGKEGGIYITAWAPADGLDAFGISAASLDRDMRVTAAVGNPYGGGEFATRQDALGNILATDASAFVLLQLTSSGWQLVVDGQLIPYVAGVLGDASDALQILDNANAALLGGAQFCVGYGTSAEEMVSEGRMIQIAVIPGTGASDSGTCFVREVAVEFYKADIDHYFITAYSDEATALDNNTAWNWVRTGETYNIWLTQAAAPANASPVCRFYGIFTNSSSSVGSHFYTIDTDECEYVKNRTDWGWGYEGFAFYAVKPVSNACPTGTSPIYRAFNNGMGGAPNHRYMTSQSVLDTMVTQGWVSEGLVFCGND